MRKRLVCSVCGGLCDSGDMERGKCFECRSIPEQEELQVRRGSEQRVPMFDLRAENGKKEENHEIVKNLD